MSKYLIKASYSPEGIKGVMAKGGSARVDAIRKLAAGVGGSLETCYFAVVLTAEQIDAAANMSVDYTPPGT